MDEFSIWDPVNVGVGQCVLWRLGALALWAERYEQEWHVLPRYDGNPGQAKASFSVRKRTEKPASTDWRHYLLRENEYAIPRPAMMDRAIVVRPDRVLILLPGERALFFISLPLWFRLNVQKSRDAGTPRKLFEFPVQPMANAWFGDPVSGDLCYFLATRLYPDFEQIPVSPVHAVCPLWISNESEKELSFDRICIHTDFLAVYRGQNRLWTNEINVLFKGTDHNTQIQPAKTAPKFDGLAYPVAEARQQIENWYVKRTFDLLKTFTGF